MVARLMKQQDPNFVINEDLSYAEVRDSSSTLLLVELVEIRAKDRLKLDWSSTGARYAAGFRWALSGPRAISLAPFAIRQALIGCSLSTPKRLAIQHVNQWLLTVLAIMNAMEPSGLGPLRLD